MNVFGVWKIYFNKYFLIMMWIFVVMWIIFEIECRLIYVKFQEYLDLKMCTKCVICLHFFNWKFKFITVLTQSDKATGLRLRT